MGIQGRPDRTDLRRLDVTGTAQDQGVTLTWHRGHFEHGAVAYDGATLIGQAARYDETDRPGSTKVVGHFYIGYVRGIQLG